ncbi:guanine deaminase [Vagococcus sp. WN89Y]|uniref:guanine deaminase n=1 Tax=Vagococcus sp. WN89Y TaxID=3457258 RepID=UPI003FCCB7EB
MNKLTSLKPFKQAIRASFFTASSARDIVFKEQAIIFLDDAGYIVKIIEHTQRDYSEIVAYLKAAGVLLEHPRSEYLLPGFIDLHIHAPQWPNLGKALDRPLDKWLQDYTFPLEAKYASASYARKVYSHLVKTLLAHGTTTAVYYSSIHHDASLELAKICLQQGQRALVGKVSMDNQDQCPDYYCETSVKEAVDACRKFIDALQKLPGNEKGRVLPVITPRFIPACTTELLVELGKLAREIGCHVQTHCSEGDWEHHYVLDRYGMTDTQALKYFGLLTPKTILAHSNLINEEDMGSIKQAGAGIAHCPLSNFYFANCVFPLRMALDKQLHVGLGTDISAGHSPSVFDACRHAITASKALNDGVDPELLAAQRGRPGSAITFKEAFWLATGGGGEVLSLPVGQLKEGFLFDALVIKTNCADSDIFINEGEDTSHDVLQKIIYNTRRSNISEVWVNGQRVMNS